MYAYNMYTLEPTMLGPESPLPRPCPVPKTAAPGPEPTPEDHVPLKAAVLEILLALAEPPLHGYAILQRVRERTGGRIRLQTGPLYRHLKRLLEDGLVAEAEGPGPEEGGDERRRYYTLTPLGRAVLSFEGERMADLVARQRALGLIQ